MQKLKLICFIVLVVLSSGCIKHIETPDTVNHNPDDFEAAWNRINGVYPFLKFKKINWDSIYNEYLPRAEAAQGDEFYEVLGDLLAELKDGHVHYGKGSKQIYPYQCPRALKDQATFSLVAVSKYLGHELFSTNSGACNFGILPNNIGYVYLPTFGHANNLAHDYAVVMDSMKTTTSLIVDLRNNPGGNANNVQALLAGFVNGEMSFPPSFRLGVREKPILIEPSEKNNYTNSVVVLINGASMSGGELAPEIFKQLPNVTVVGDTTGGALGILSDRNDISNSTFFLSGGRSICTPTGHFLAYNGSHLEWNGVAPDIYVEQTREDIENGVDKQLEYAIELLKNKE